MFKRFLRGLRHPVCIKGLDFKSPGLLGRMRTPTVEVGGLIRFRYPRTGRTDGFPAYHCSCGHTNMREGVYLHLIQDHGLSENHARLIMRDATVREESDEEPCFTRADHL